MPLYAAFFMDKLNVLVCIKLASNFYSYPLFVPRKGKKGRLQAMVFNNTFIDWLLRLLLVMYRSIYPIQGPGAIRARAY
ncbi:hypothetical protein GCM10011356_12750 [Kangiella profundi]|nr:hypothetical protein GCM10011356_12750 [Kangiella profundi]